jgi:hypothetical protein
LALTESVFPDRPVVVPENQAEQAGFRHDQVKINPVHGGGFPANVEGLHHLHCLVRDIRADVRKKRLTVQNLLRQALWYNFEYYHVLGKGAFQNDDRIVRLHVCEKLGLEPSNDQVF